MTISQLRPLMRRARTNFRPGPTTSDSQARHYRRAWIRAVVILGPKWVYWPTNHHD